MPMLILGETLNYKFQQNQSNRNNILLDLKRQKAYTYNTYKFLFGFLSHVNNTLLKNCLELVRIIMIDKIKIQVVLWNFYKSKQDQFGFEIVIANNFRCRDRHESIPPLDTGSRRLYVSRRKRNVFIALSYFTSLSTRYLQRLSNLQN